MSIGPDSYEATWRPRLDHIRALKAAGETNLSRVVRLVETSWLSRVGQKGVAFGRPIEAPAPVLVGGRRWHRTRSILDACRPDTDLMVELGSGWGNNLVEVYLGGGPLRAAYVAMEPTATGRACAAELAELEPGMDLRVMAVDLFHPDYSVLPRGGSHAVVYTSHAIEQIDQLPEEAITGLFDLAEEVTGVHLEPIGWQMERQSEVGADEARCRRLRYNENLWPLLSRLAQCGAIEILSATPDIFAQKRHNVSSLIVWRTRRP